ncbi:MAG: hypothetical protein WCO23_04810 [bacterium]
MQNGIDSRRNTINKLIIVILVTTFSALVGFAADSQLTVDLGGKTTEGQSWRLVRRDFNPGTTEVEVDLGANITDKIVMSGAYTMNSKGQEYLGLMIQNSWKEDKSAGFAQLTQFSGLGEANDKTRLLVYQGWSVTPKIALGACGLTSHTEGTSLDRSYWEAGPVLQVAVAQTPRMVLWLQPIVKTGDKEGVNIFLVTRF